MIDARDHIGVPVITDCPTYIRRDGITYEIAADAMVTRESDLRIQFVEETLGVPLTPWQAAFLVPTHYRANRPTGRGWQAA